MIRVCENGFLSLKIDACFLLCASFSPFDCCGDVYLLIFILYFCDCFFIMIDDDDFYVYINAQYLLLAHLCLLLLIISLSAFYFLRNDACEPLYFYFCLLIFDLWFLFYSFLISSSYFILISFLLFSIIFSLTLSLLFISFLIFSNRLYVSISVLFKLILFFFQFSHFTFFYWRVNDAHAFSKFFLIFHF